MKQKNEKLAVQVSLMVTVAFILALLLIGSIVFNGTKRMYFQSNNEQIEKELNECRNLLMNPSIVGWVLDQWQSDPDMMQEPMTDMERIYFDSFLYSRFVAELDDLDELLDMDAEQQRAYVKTIYLFLSNWIDDRRDVGKFDRFLLLDVRSKEANPSPSRDDYYIIMECSEESDELGHHFLGQHLDAEDGYSFLSILNNGVYGVDYGDILYHEMTGGQDAMYVAVSPVFVDEEMRYVVCLEYNWDTFSYILNENVRTIALWGGISLLAVNLLLVLFIYFKAVRPLVQVNRGIHAYMENKNSQATVESMGKIREKNEVGILADSIAAMAVEIDRSTEENLRLNGERERVAAELDLAAKIQSGSLPSAFPERKDAALFASMTPAKEVGGDFYDFFFIDDDHLGLVIADVSGKGVPAALFMMMSKNLIKNYAMMGLSPAEVLNRTNVSLCENNRNKMFVTVWFGILNLKNGQVTAANGGHEYPMLRKAGGNFELFREPHGSVLGAMKKKTYSEYVFDIEPGGTLFVYTDGAPEATNTKEQLFGLDRMLLALNQAPDSEPKKLLQAMKEAIDRFVGDAPQFDDLTMLCVKYLPNNEQEESR